MATGPPIEARSLDELNVLASNPPNYSETPKKNEPLVLYISRVPGERTILLSPLKPSKKNVCEADVLSALYVVNLVPSDQAAGRLQLLEPDSNGNAQIMKVPRKPLPESARPMTPDSASSSNVNLAAPPVPNGRQRGASIASQDDGSRPALPSSVATESYTPEPSADGPSRTLQIPPSIQTAPARKPVGPRVMPGPSMAFPDGSPAPAAGGRDRSDSVASAMQEMRRAQEAVANSSRSPSPRKQSVVSLSSLPGELFLLDLIRRNPSTGEQWDVGTVASRQSEHGLPKTGPLPFGGPTSSLPINIYLENSGYAKFRPPRGSTAKCIMFRQLQMGYAKSFMSNINISNINISNINISNINMSNINMSNFKGMIQGMGSRGRSDSDSSQELGASGQPGPDMTRRGYTFTSPWNGQCNFRTGASGGTVRCYHTPHVLNNSLAQVCGQSPEGQGGDAAPPPSYCMSELRFDLPIVEKLMDQEATKNLLSKLRWPAADHQHDDATLLSHYDDTAPLAVSPPDVNLGAEQAGGGTRGNRAKLGKLIIYDEGQKMLDLTVAANIGIWWGAWERIF
ncbi:hypothetical protein ISF_00602 [Cordyceps fumosorosea ARSEF 2679]|uniref:Oxidoreductase-like protein n=1 Tax=Cordyceps fumosorosea (strain ARSEF 2679) TaxID=1081104 RepID=A0A168EE25_CORFA|nr:hypothetical protein ISF_00602 [Cordyceps fumosorosea ARSEF 2679]OAA73701.1 hypothetical protein ISF_00602 [Cordyceps fumosorosea ARSEF 2679]